ncbi:hypothetical protein [Falsirhodobacter deserti]|uniref:hypothetical protein n=1 Tax=Falsirhodobacter deserti TaxID=1365611 RepID=UPI001F4DA35B|nr:hypothetical protein [Falsirhodobacter deserti]
MEQPKSGMDWEGTMKSAEKNSQMAAAMTERAVAALADVMIQMQDHGRRLRSIQAQIKMLEESQPQPKKETATLPPSQPGSQYRWARLRLVHLYALGAAAAFGVSIANW